MTICNACRYCESLCAVFPAMEKRRTFPEHDLNYLANLCHNCGACYYACQYAPPHEFAVNVPKTMSELRNHSYAKYAWPNFGAGFFERNGLFVSIIAAFSVASFLIMVIIINQPDILFASHVDAGAFYKIIPHTMMVTIFGAAFIYATLALMMGIRNYWRDITDTTFAPTLGAILQAIKDASKLRYLRGGGGGCMTETDQPSDKRKIYHHMTFDGFMLCFASTTVATLYHYLFAWEAPYEWLSIPVILGVIGGLGLLIGPAGLMIEKWRQNPELKDESRFGMEIAFILMLFLTSATGLGLLIFRETSAMGILLAIHLGVVFGLFITMPYGKFVHGIYRAVALTRYAMEEQSH